MNDVGRTESDRDMNVFLFVTAFFLSRSVNKDLSCKQLFKGEEIIKVKNLLEVAVILCKVFRE